MADIGRKSDELDLAKIIAKTTQFRRSDGRAFSLHQTVRERVSKKFGQFPEVEEF